MPVTEHPTFTEDTREEAMDAHARMIRSLGLKLV